MPCVFFLPFYFFKKPYCVVCVCGRARVCACVLFFLFWEGIVRGVSPFEAETGVREL